MRFRDGLWSGTGHKGRSARVIQKGAAGLVGAAERRGPCSGTHVGRGEVDVTGVEDDIIVGVADACRRERRVGRGSVRLRREGVGNSEIAAPSVHQRALLSLTTSHVPWPKSWAALKPSTSSKVISPALRLPTCPLERPVIVYVSGCSVAARERSGEKRRFDRATSLKGPMPAQHPAHPGDFLRVPEYREIVWKRVNTCVSFWNTDAVTSNGNYHSGL